MAEPIVPAIELVVPTIKPIIPAIVLIIEPIVPIIKPAIEPIVPSIEPAAELNTEPTTNPSYIAISKVFSKGRTILLALLRYKKQ